MDNHRRRGNRGIEENLMAILDGSGFTKKTHHAIDDCVAFLEAVRFASVVPENRIPPTRKMFEAVFKILKNENSVDVIVSSYQLLNELEKCFPRVYASKSEKSEVPSPGTALLELVVVKEAWSPFVFGVDSTYGEAEADKISSGSLDSPAFHLLIQDLAEGADKKKSKGMDLKFLRNMLQFQYLVNVLEGDFFPRNAVYKETMNWNHLRESLLTMLLGARRMSYKNLVKDCISVINKMVHNYTEFSNVIRNPEDSSAELYNNGDATLSIAVPEMEKSTCIAVEKLMLMIIELDISKKNADMQGLTTRTDGVRTPLVEVILDEMTYNKDCMSSFFQVFNDPKWKLDIIVQYFSKYISKPTVRTRRSSGSTDDHLTFDAVLKCFSNGTSTKSITKKMDTQDAQLLLAHAFQAYLSLPSQKCVEGEISDSKKCTTSIAEICKNVISAFTCIRKAEGGKMQLLAFGKEAVFSAATILMSKRALDR